MKIKEGQIWYDTHFKSLCLIVAVEDNGAWVKEFDDFDGNFIRNFEFEYDYEYIGVL